ncbi:unnamed protein product [Meloidogyne enterolobii]|uniref:Uncharacterized protein n=1 Tax=Meloidogyne enterolobii TaxID=390850 RepID=A0ACB0XQC8_MELEN
MQVIDNIQKQYYNLCYAYHELCAEFTAISQQIHYYQSIIWNYQVYARGGVRLVSLRKD